MLISLGAALDKLVTDRSEPLSLFLPSLVASDELTDAALTVGGTETDGLGVQLGENENVDDAPGLVETGPLENFSDPESFYKYKALHNMIGEVWQV